MAELIVGSGKHQGKKLTLPDTEVVIGRDEACHVRLATNDVSRRHCAIRPTPQGRTVRDLGSRNGTFVNELPIRAETLLKPGDMLRVGPLQLAVPGRKEPAARPHVKLPAAVPADAPSDDDITAWLSDDAPAEFDTRPSDTTIIPGKPATTEAPAASAPVPPPTPPIAVSAVPTPERKKFQSLAEEAADIIRRHHERQKAGKPD